MSNAIAQSTNPLTVSGITEENYNFNDACERASNRTAKGTTRERKELQYNKLTSWVAADYRAHFAAIYGKSERLPANVFNQIEDAVTSYVQKQMAVINPGNVISMRRAFYHKFNDTEVCERVNIIGENKVTLQEQLLGINLFIGSAERQLKALEAKPTPNFDREKAVKQRIMKFTLTKEFIMGEISRQEMLTKATS